MYVMHIVVNVLVLSYTQILADNIDFRRIWRMVGGYQRMRTTNYMQRPKQVMYSPEEIDSINN
jgi:hypothetical protein